MRRGLCKERGGETRNENACFEMKHGNDSINFRYGTYDPTASSYVSPSVSKHVIPFTPRFRVAFLRWSSTISKRSTRQNSAIPKHAHCSARSSLPQTDHPRADILVGRAAASENSHPRSEPSDDPRQNSTR